MLASEKVERRKRREKKLIAKAFGNEPVFDSPLEPNDVRLILAYNWYNENVKIEDAKGWLVNYTANHKPEALARIAKEEIKFMLPCAISRLYERGIKLPDRTLAWLDNWLGSYTQPVVENKPKRVIARKIIAPPSHADEAFAGYEILYDNVVKNINSKETFYNLLVKHNVKPQEVRDFLRDIKLRQKEIRLALTKRDDIAVEAMRNYKRAQLKKLDDFLGDSVQAGMRFIDSHKVKCVRRKKKIVPATKLVAKVKFQQTNTEYGLKSVEPTEVVGATMLIAFNAKYRYITVYESTLNNTLSVKGTTIQNYDEKTSIRKKIRKPVDFFAKLRTATNKNNLNKLIGSVKAKPQKINGRINADTILLKTYR